MELEFLREEVDYGHIKAPPCKPGTQTSPCTGTPSFITDPARPESDIVAAAAAAQNVYVADHIVDVA